MLLKNNSGITSTCKKNKFHGPIDAALHYSMRGLAVAGVVATVVGVAGGRDFAGKHNAPPSLFGLPSPWGDAEQPKLVQTTPHELPGVRLPARVLTEPIAPIIP